MMGSGERDALAVYLNDHLAGSVAADDLLGHLIEDDPAPALRRELLYLQAGLQAGQRTLRALVDLVGSENKLSQAMAWVGEKVARLKVGYGASDTSLRRFEALETLALGFCGRQLLWRTLGHVRKHGALPSDIDYHGLEEKAGRDAAILEGLRLDAAVGALTHDTAA